MKTLNIYVASTWENRAAAKQMMEWLQGCGCYITRDWTGHSMQSDVWRDDPEKRQIAGLWAADDISQGVQTADVVIVLQEGIAKLRTGCACELGAALALQKDVILYGAQSEPESPFQLHPAILRLPASPTALLAALAQITLELGYV